MRPDFNDAKYRAIENPIEECFAYATDLETYCSSIEALLEESYVFLGALHTCHVEKWDKYNDAMEIVKKYKNENKT